jgi:excisionase family DNA binding protein
MTALALVARYAFAALAPVPENLFWLRAFRSLFGNQNPQFPTGVKFMYADTKSASIQMLLRPDEAAQALAISPRTLWTMTHQGQIPCFRNGRIVRYYVDDLRKWIEAGRASQPN